MALASESESRVRAPGLGASLAMCMPVHEGAVGGDQVAMAIVGQQRRGDGAGLVVEETILKQV